MKHKSRVDTLAHSLKGLFVNKKPNVTFLKHKDRYYHAYWMPKNLCDGVSFIAKTERISEKAAAEKLITLGFSSYVGSILENEIRDSGIAYKTDALIAQKRFIMLLKRLAKENGVDLSNVI
jgi:hypothetical protein